MRIDNGSFIDYLSGLLTDSDMMAAKALTTVSAAVLKKRISLDMNQKKFADLCNVSQAMISKWESGDYNFTIETIASICERLGLEFDIIIRKANESYAGNVLNYRIDGEPVDVVNNEDELITQAG